MQAPLGQWRAALQAALEEIGKVMKVDHPAIPVTDCARSRDWYVATLGFEVEFEIPDRHTVALQDSNGFTIFLQQVPDEIVPNGTALWLQVDDVDASFPELSARGVKFAHDPHKTFWGYGTELADPDGYLPRLWDERTMREK